jgi:hypothetical protein
MPKLTEAQKRAVELLKQGEANSENYGGPWWVYGVRDSKIAASTMNALVKKGIAMVFKKEGYAFQRFARLVKEADHA